jgi:hypothetical protein
VQDPGAHSHVCTMERKNVKKRKKINSFFESRKKYLRDEVYNRLVGGDIKRCVQLWAAARVPNGNFLTLSSHRCAWKKRLTVLVLANRGCQMACFQTETRDLGEFWRALEWRNLVYFIDVLENIVAMWCILWPFVKLVAIWYTYFSPFWYIVPRKIWQPRSQTACGRKFLHSCLIPIWNTITRRRRQSKTSREQKITTN